MDYEKKHFIYSSWITCNSVEWGTCDVNVLTMIHTKSRVINVISHCECHIASLLFEGANNFISVSYCVDVCYIALPMS